MRTFNRRQEMTQLEAKTFAFFQFLGHNVPINCLKLLGVRKNMKPLNTAFIRGNTHVSACKIDQVMKKGKN